MRVLSAAQINACDRYTIEHEPISSLDLMERAGMRLGRALRELLPRSRSYWVVCGTGNNGGDGLVLARELHGHGLQVRVITLPGARSTENESNLERAQKAGIDCSEMADACGWMPAPDTVIVDALYGIGISRPLQGPAADLVRRINELPNTVVALDLPSGLSPDCAYTSTPQNTVCADHTLSVQGPKLAFFMPENQNFVGHFSCIDIGLLPQGLAQSDASPIWVGRTQIAALIRPRPRVGHKGTFGHLLVVAGSESKAGAALLCSKAAVRSGCGLVTVQAPPSVRTALNCYVPEAMLAAPTALAYDEMQRYDALAVGPGMGTDEAAIATLWQMLKSGNSPIVLDADALTILAQHPHWYNRLGPHAVLTPHPGEFDRLTQPHTTGAERYRSALAFAQQHRVNVVLKGYRTLVVTHAGATYFNSTGNDGMATAGSGDVLTGILGSLLAQGYAPAEAAVLGVYLHGYAGDLAATDHSRSAMIASDIVEHIGGFFKRFERVEG